MPPAQAGFALIEVLISGVIAVIAIGAVFTLMQASTRSAASQRVKSQAYAIAQEDQVRLRSLRTPSLKNIVNSERSVVLDGRTFTVTSNAKFVNNVTQDSGTCDAESASPDYVRIASAVTWTKMYGAPPVTISSIIAPPRGSLDPTLGTLAITATNAAGGPLSSVGLSGTGAGTFSGSTNVNGCAIFTDLPAGNYTLKLSGSVLSMVDNDGNAPVSKTVSVIANATNSVGLQYDLPGQIKASFTTENYSGGPIAAAANAITVFNTGMGSDKKFTITKSESSLTTTKTLFPFSSPYAIYAGSCSANNPNPDGLATPEYPEASASVTVPANGLGTGTIKLPALLLNVRSGSSSSSGINGAAVKVIDTVCGTQRNYTTETIKSSAGRLKEPGLPWGTYDICASASVSGTTRHDDNSDDIPIHNTGGTTVNIIVNSNDSKGGC